MFWPYSSIRMLVLRGEWLGYNTSLSLRPKSLTKAILTTLWPFWTFSSWSCKSVGLFPFPMEMAKVLFKHFPFFHHTSKHVSLLPPQLIWIEWCKWIHPPARLCLSEFLHKNEVKQRMRTKGTYETCYCTATQGHLVPGWELLCRGLLCLLKTLTNAL